MSVQETGEGAYYWSLGDDGPEFESLQVRVTDEGVIFDVYDSEGLALVATLAMTFDEWIEHVIANDNLARTYT